MGTEEKILWGREFTNRFLVPGRVIIFGAIWAQTPFFGLFYLKSYDDEIWYVDTLCDLEYECPNLISIFGRKPAIWAQTPFFGLFYLKLYDDEIWYVGTLSDLEYECPNRISIFGRKPILWAQTPFFGFFGLFKD